MKEDREQERGGASTEEKEETHIGDQKRGTVKKHVAAYHHSGITVMKQQATGREREREERKRKTEKREKERQTEEERERERRLGRHTWGPKER